MELIARFLRVVVLSILLAATNTYAVAESRTIIGKTYQVLGIRIAKSGSARLANLAHEDAQMLRRSTYLAAGTRLLVFKHFVRDSKQRQWGLATTGEGLIVYVRTDGTHFYPASRMKAWARQGKPFAISQDTMTIRTERYGSIGLSPSMVFAFEPMEGDDIGIVINADTVGQRYKGDETVTVPIDSFAIIHPDDFDVSRFSSPFEQYDAGSELSRIIKGLSDLSLSKEERRRILTYLDTRLISEKKCASNVDFSKKIDASVAADFSTILSPIDAKLKISGSYNSSTVFPVGTAFKFARYVREDEVVEIKHETLKETCANLASEQRIITKTSTGLEAQLNTVAVQNIGLSVTAEGLPVYTCRAEYMDLLDMLTEDQDLSPQVAGLVIARFGRFKGERDASSCQKAGT